ncbi:MAG: hypothetical protein RJQ04_03165 [Longimicrobiales bacterium]
MDPEIWVVVAAVFISGGAIGTSGTLLAQWLLKKLSQPDETPRRAFRDVDLEVLRADVAEMDRKLRNVDARLDFQEQLLGGGTPTTIPPPRLEEGGGDAVDELPPPPDAPSAG